MDGRAKRAGEKRAQPRRGPPDAAELAQRAGEGHGPQRLPLHAPPHQLALRRTAARTTFRSAFCIRNS